MRHSRFAALALLLLGLASACGSAHHSAAPATSIVLESDSYNGCGQTYYAIHPDGSGLSRLFSAGHCPSVYWKADGTKALVVPEQDDPSLEPYIVDPRSGTKQRVGVDGLYNANYPPDQPWSPNGKRMLLALGKPDYSGDDLVIYNPKDGTWKALDNHGEYGAPVWAADGKSVIFPTTHGIAAARLNGATQMILRLPRWYPTSVHVSSDGKWISFTRDGPALYVVRSNGKGLRRILGAGAGTWSPEGARLSYQDSAGVHVVDAASAKTRLVVQARGASPNGPHIAGAPTFWSPDGRWILYAEKDLAFAAPVYDHQQVWVVRPNGKDAHPVTAVYTRGVSLQVQPSLWATSSLRGTPVRRPPLVAAQGHPVLTTQLPIVALGALGEKVAVATGFGQQQGAGVRYVHAPRGPIILVGPNGGTLQRPLPKNCVTVSTLLLTATQLGYVCDNSQFEGARYAFWLRRKKLVSVNGGQGVGTFLGGPVTDGRTIVYDINDNPLGPPPHYNPLPGTTRIYELRGSSPQLLRTVPGDSGATVEALDHGRIVLVHYGRSQRVEVLSPDGSARKFRFRTDYLNGVALHGQRLVVANDGRLTVVDLVTGHKRGWRMAPATAGYGKQLMSVHGDFAAYVAGAAIHVMRLSDGHEVVIDTPGAAGPVLAQFVEKGLYYAYNEAYAKTPGRVGFISATALEHAISSKGRPAP